MERKVRFNEAFNFLRMKGRIKTQKECANLMNYKEGTFSRALKGNPDCLTDNFLRTFNSTFDNIFNIDWLLKGEGSMFSDEYTTFNPVGMAKPVPEDGVSISDVSDQDLKIEILQERYDEAMRYVKKLEADNIVLQETNKRLLDMLERALSGATSSVQSKAQ